MALSYLNAAVHRALQLPLFVPLTFDDTLVLALLTLVGMLVLVSDEWSWPPRRIVGEELTEEETGRSHRGVKGEEERPANEKLEQS